MEKTAAKVVYDDPFDHNFGDCGGGACLRFWYCTSNLP